VNFFGLVHVTQAALPVLRKQAAGHIIQVSTVGGVTTFPTLGGYHASKWAVEGFSETLAKEVAGFGIKVTLVEPGGFATDWAGSSAVHATPIPEYDPVRAALRAGMAQLPPAFIGDPKAAGPALLTIVDAAEPPLRVFFGVMPHHIVPGVYAERLKTWKDWEAVSIAANGHA
jgi:NAD(P)-dependent dehydrogenase (short-subunit alcohol dehydrogenase family)